MNAILDVVVDTQRRAGAVDTQEMLSFLKLRVDQRSIEFIALVLEIIGPLPKGHAEDAVNESTSTSKFSFTFRLPSTSTSTSLI